MDSWKNVKKFGASLERVHACFEFSFYPHMPDGSKIKIKVLEDIQGNFIACMNARILSSDDSSGQIGLGETPEQALENVIAIFHETAINHIKTHGLLREEDFIWSDAMDFLHV